MGRSDIICRYSFLPVLAINLFVIPCRLGFVSCSDAFVTFSMC